MNDDTNNRISQYWRNALRWYRNHDMIVHGGVTLMSAVFVVSSLYVYSFTPAKSFHTGSVVTIDQGMTLKQTAERLQQQGVIRSALVFESIVIMMAGDTNVVFGDYFFPKAPSAIDVANRVVHGEFDLEPIKVTIPEGATIYDVADIFDKRFPQFDRLEFLQLARNDEGYLFPDTYFFTPNVKAINVYQDMRANFDQHMESLVGEMLRQGKTLDEIIIMASIIEKEARTPESRRMISGILWKRIAKGMPLQVDATFLYINGKNTFDLTLKDLKADSPYNTYKYAGLPIGPIANPGMDSILAALYPKQNPYLFYLSDMSGNMHYSVTYAQHSAKASMYLP